MEHEDGHVYIYALRNIERDEELSYNYALIYDGWHTAAVRRAFQCCWWRILLLGGDARTEAWPEIAGKRFTNMKPISP